MTFFDLWKRWIFEEYPDTQNNKSECELRLSSLKNKWFKKWMHHFRYHKSSPYDLNTILSKMLTDELNLENNQSDSWTNLSDQFSELDQLILQKKIQLKIQIHSWIMNSHKSGVVLSRHFFYFFFCSVCFRGVPFLWFSLFWVFYLSLLFITASGSYFPS